MDSAEFSDTHAEDPRWQQLKDAMLSIRKVLEELGSFKDRPSKARPSAFSSIVGHPISGTLDIQGRYKLRVQILAATDLKSPDYRVGDFTKKMVYGKDAIISSVFIEIILGDLRRESVPANDVKDGNAEFADAEVLIAYRGEAEAVFNLRNKREWAVLNGDPFIGQGILPLPGELQDCQLRSVTLPVVRGEETSGHVRLQYQLLKVDGAN